MSLEKDITQIKEAFPMPQSPRDKADGMMGKSTYYDPDDLEVVPESVKEAKDIFKGASPEEVTARLYKRTPIVKADWECEVVPTPKEKGGYGFMLIIYKDEEVVHQQAGYGSVGTAQAAARDYVLLQEFDISRENEE